MKPANLTFGQLQPQMPVLKTRELSVEDPDNFQRAMFLCDFSQAGSLQGYQLSLNQLIDFGTAKRCVIDARFMPFDLIFSLSDSLNDFVVIPAGSRMRFNLFAIPVDTFTIFTVSGPSAPFGYARVYLDNVVSSETSSDVMTDSAEYMYTGSITAAGVATPISVSDQSGVMGLPYVTRWGYIAPKASATALSELDVQLTLSGGYAAGQTPIPLLSSNVGAAVGGGTDGLTATQITRVIWLPTVVPTPANEGNPKTFTATPSYPFGAPAGFVAPNNVIVYLWATRGLK